MPLLTSSDSTTRSETGVTFHPVGRNYNDRISDTKLRTRINAGVWLLQQRFYEALPDGNIVVVTPGFLFLVLLIRLLHFPFALTDCWLN